VDRLKAQTTENELLRKELRNVRAKLEQEQSSRCPILIQYFFRSDQLTPLKGLSHEIDFDNIAKN
jgi:hypothetical protein